MVNIQWLSFLSFPANLWLFQCVDITPESEQSWNTMVRLNVRGWLVVIVWNCFVETGSSLGQTVSLTLTSVTSTTHSRDGASSPSFHRPGIPTFFFFKKKKKVLIWIVDTFLLGLEKCWLYSNWAVIEFSSQQVSGERSFLCKAVIIKFVVVQKKAWGFFLSYRWSKNGIQCFLLDNNCKSDSLA